MDSPKKKQRNKSAAAIKSLNSTRNLLMIEQHVQEDVEEEFIAGQRTWQKEANGFKSGEERRLNRIQSKLKKAINDLEL